MSMLDKLYFVTINHSQENYDDCLRRAQYMSLPNVVNYEFRGVNGKEQYPTNELLNEAGYDVYNGWNLVNNSNGFWNRDMTRGEIGCILSHIDIWEDAYNNGYNQVLILEDDFFPLKPIDWNFMNLLNDYDWDLFYIGRMAQTGFGVPDEPTEDGWIAKTGFSYQTHGYMLTKEGIRKLVEDHLPTLKQNLIPADEFLPCTYGKNPREDVQSMYSPNINSYGFADWENQLVQIRTEVYGNSQTAPVKGIDY